MKRTKLIFIVALCVAYVAFADFTVTVTPGFQFPTDPATAQGLMTLDNLNLLAQPTVKVSGTLDGTTGLTPGTVDGSLLADSVPDATNIVWNLNNPRQLSLSTTAAGNGLLGGGGDPLSVNLDTSKFTIITDKIYFNSGAVATTNLQTDCVQLNNITNGPPFTLIGFTNAPGNTTAIGIGAGLSLQTNGVGSPCLVLSNNVTATFDSLVLSLGTGQITNVTHGFPGVPQFTQWVLVCQQSPQTGTDLGYAVGDEVPVETFFNGSQCAFSPGRNATTFWVSASSINPSVIHKNSNARDAITAINWKIKCHAVYFY